MTPGCLDEDVLGQLLEGRLSGPGRARAEAHLDTCARCRRLVALAGADEAPAAAAIVEPGAATVDGLARYALGPRLASTEAGALYAAHDHRLRRDVVIQLLEPGPAGATERLRAQAQVQARIDHPNVGRILEVGEADGRPYLVMHLAEVEPLARAALAMSLEEKVRVLRDVALAVHAAHEVGCAHGALGGGSVLIERGEDGAPAPRVFGFGAAASAPVERRTDVHALGGLLYQLGAGRAPSTSERALVPLRRVSPGVPRDLDRVAMRCLRAAPEDRYPTALEVARELDRYLDGEPVLARGAGALGQVGGWLRRRRALVVVAAVAGVVALVAGLAADRAARAERRAVVERALARGRASEDAARVPHQRGLERGLGLRIGEVALGADGARPRPRRLGVGAAPGAEQPERELARRAR